MVRCTFCDENIRAGTGKMFVFKDGKISRFCGMKCEKNSLKLGRTAARLKWTNTNRKKRVKK
ncbi:50S ribosomal protein L24e [Candidatus Woesearchaeota archaeon]|nr:50S ribosomal protein L24e [Candidatus Woesearchaeota archaeon]